MDNTVTLYDHEGVWQITGLTTDDAMRYWVARLWQPDDTPQYRVITDPTTTISTTTALLDAFWSQLPIHNMVLVDPSKELVWMWCIMSQLQHPAAIAGIRALAGEVVTEPLPVWVLPYVQDITAVHRCYYHLYVLQKTHTLKEKCTLDLVTLFEPADSFSEYIRGINTDDLGPQEHNTRCHNKSMDECYLLEDGSYVCGTIHGWVHLWHPVDIAVMDALCTETLHDGVV